MASSKSISMGDFIWEQLGLLWYFFPFLVTHTFPVALGAAVAKLACAPPLPVT